jgi:hypothetical protein
MGKISPSLTLLSDGLLVVFWAAACWSTGSMFVVLVCFVVCCCLSLQLVVVFGLFGLLQQKKKVLEVVSKVT